MSAADIALLYPRLLPYSIFARPFSLVIGAILCSHLITSLMSVDID